MKVLKKLGAMLIAACMLLQVVAVAAPVPEDVIGTEYESAASLLCALDLMVGDGTNFNPDANVTRAEFAQIMINIMGLKDAAASMTPTGVFTDVGVSEWYASPVEMGAKMGAINGYGDGNFGPNDNVTGQQAVKLMIYATGWEVRAADQGGYPTGYVSVAQEKDMLLGLSSLDLTQPMTRGQVALLLVNSLKANMLQKVGSGTKVEYVEKDGVNLLSSKHDVYRYDGIVTQNDVTSLYSSVSTLNDNYVEITSEDNTGEIKLFLEGETTIGNQDVLGKSVRAWYYYDDDKDVSTIVSYDLLDSRNTVKTVSLEDIEYSTLSQTLVEYWPDVDAARTSKIYVKEGVPAVIYNGVAVTLTHNFVNLIKEAIENRQTGSVTFIATNGDTEASVISITAYDTYVVDRVLEDDYTVIDKFGAYNKNSTKTNKSFVLDVEDPNVIATIVDTDDYEVEFEDLAEWDVLSVAMSPANMLPVVARVIVSNETVEGTVEEINAKKDSISFTVDGEEYELASNYINNLAKGKEIGAADLSAVELEGIKVGYTANFYLDSFGKIAAHEVTSASEDAYFGIITKYAPAVGASGKVMVKVYADGEITTYNFASRVKIDGVNVKESELIATLDSIAKEDVLYAADYVMPVLYETNADDEISYLDTTVKGADESEYSLHYVYKGTKKDPNDDTKTIPTVIAENASYKSNMVNGKYSLSGSAAVLTLPENTADLDDTKNMSTKKASALTATSDSKGYNMALLSTEESQYKAAYAVIVSASGGDRVVTALADSDGTPRHDKQMHVVQGVSKIYDEETEETTIKVYALTEGNTVELTFDVDYYNNNNTSSEPSNIKAAVEDIYKNAQLAVPADRLTNPLREGDVILVRQAEDDKAVIFMEFVYAMGDNIFKYNDQGPVGGNSIRYRAIDIGFAKNYADSMLEMQYIVDKRNAPYSTNKYHQIFFDANNYPLLSFAGDKEDVFTPDALGTAYDKDVTVWEDKVSSTCYPIPASSFKIMKYDADEKAGARVSKGSVNDLKLAIDGVAPSIVLIQYRSDAPRGMYIINL